jgi:signal transduction histidine kinase/ABC-type amino acid transport substrate-binding protein
LYIWKPFRNLILCISALFCACSLLPCSVRAAGAAAQMKTVKVGVLNNTTYADQDENGVWRGIDVECLISIAQKAGFQLEFIDSTNDPDFMGSLDNGTYDIVTDVVKTPERAEKYLFTDESLGTTNSTLAVKQDDKRWNYGNIEQISSMKVGVLSSYANNQDFRDWCRKHEITPEIGEYEDIGKMTDALQKGKIDGEVYTALYSKEGAPKLRAIMKFLPESYYFAFRKDDIELKNEVDDALAQILSNNVDYLLELKNKYEAEYSANLVPFSTEEDRYIAAHPERTVAVIAGDEPYFEKDASGASQGIIPDYFKLLTDQTGIAFRYHLYPTHEEAVAAVKNGEADIVGVFSGGAIAANQSQVALTDRYAVVSSILLTGKGKNVDDIRSIALKHRARDSMSVSIRRILPDAEIKEYENVRQCFSALDKGKTDAVLVGLPSATWMINQTQASSYSIIPVPDMSTDLCAAVRIDDPILCSILNKGIAATRTNFSGIVTKDTLPESDWKTVIMRIPPTIIILVAAALLALFIGLTWALIMLRRRQNERAAVLAAQAETEKQKLQVESIKRNAEERNRFFANISHDMRTPLNAVLGFAREAQKEDITPEQRNDCLSKVETSGKLLLDLINDTLTISRTSSGKLQLRPEPCRAADLLQAVTDPIREAADRKQVELLVDVTHMQDKTILVDRLNTEKIFLNLLTNAVKYTPAGGHVWYTVRQEAQNGSEVYYTVTVRDDGIGVSSAFLPHIFEPFAQEKRQGYESVGTGLGLSIVKQLVDLMGGTIQVESEVGRGTAFTVKLHFREVPAENAEADTEAFRKQEKDLNGLSVLLCEDNQLNQEVALSLLKDKGMNADIAPDGLSGVRMFSESSVGKYDLILMDIRMPELNGYEAAKSIRAMNRADAERIPIIAMTADAFDDDIRKCMDSGMNGHVAKPIEPAQLYRTIAETLRRREDL